jgi:hypothetical protein
MKQKNRYAIVEIYNFNKVAAVVKKPNRSDRARQKRRQRKIERNRRKRRKLLKARVKGRGHKRNPRHLSMGEILYDLHERGTLDRRQKEIFEYYERNVNVSVSRRALAQLRRDKRTVEFPETFSFIEAPDDALSAIYQLVDSCNSGNRRTVRIRQDGCKEIDYGAEAVASILTKAASSGHGVRFRGTYPEEREPQLVVRAAGIPKYLGISDPNLPNFNFFTLHHGRKNDKQWGHLSAEKERVSEEFIQYLQDSLHTSGYELNEEGEEYISGLVGEVITNCEDHAGRDDWWIGGYTRLNATLGVADCHVSIVNFGNTIYETILEMPKDTEQYEVFSELVNKHSKPKPLGAGFREEELWTLYALQQNVSRFRSNTNSAGRDRGQGTADMIRFFQRLGGTNVEGLNPKMVVVSGSTCILFDDDYEMTDETESLSSVITFNDEDKLSLPPDKDKVKQLTNYFPGTIMSLKFYLDRDYLKQETSEA